MIISDVDETIADLYLPATTDIIYELIKLLNENKIIFFITGQSKESVIKRIVDFIPLKLHKNILIGHCSGCEVWGFDFDGNLKAKSYYSCYENILSNLQKQKWREIINQTITEFDLQIFKPMSIPEFTKLSNNNPKSIILEDRGPQITFEVINGYKLNFETKNILNKEFNFDSDDFRDIIMKFSSKLLKENDVPITARKAGVFAIDFAIENISKTTAVEYVIKNEKLLNSLGIENLNNPSLIEVWGDKFALSKDGTDMNISLALDKNVRSITFRTESPDDFIKGYNIVIWNGKKHLHEGTLEYLQTRI